MPEKPTCTPAFEDEALDEWAQKIADQCTDNGDGTFSLQLDGVHQIDGETFNRIWSKLFERPNTEREGDE